MHPEMETDFSKWRLIFRPKSLVLGWWGGMHLPHPPPKSATDRGCLPLCDVEAEKYTSSFSLQLTHAFYQLPVYNFIRKVKADVQMFTEADLGIEVVFKVTASLNPSFSGSLEQVAVRNPKPGCQLNRTFTSSSFGLMFLARQIF